MGTHRQQQKTTPSLSPKNNMHASSLQWLEDFILASSVLCNLLAYANGRRMKYGCMFEILGKRQDKSAILT
jgi:hypothetical protein